MASIEADLYGFDSSDNESQPENTTGKATEDGAAGSSKDSAAEHGATHIKESDGNKEAVAEDGSAVDAVNDIGDEVETAGKKYGGDVNGVSDNNNDDDDEDDDDDDDDDGDDSSDSDDGIEVKLNDEEETTNISAVAPKKELNISVKQQQIEAKTTAVEVHGQQTALDINAAGTVEGVNIYDYDIEGSDKPWRKAGAKLKDYFNYGFDERTWQLYCEKQKEIRREIHGLKEIAIVQRNTQGPRGMMGHPPDGMRGMPPRGLGDRRGGPPQMHVGPPTGRQGGHPPFPPSEGPAGGFQNQYPSQMYGPPGGGPPGGQAGGGFMGRPGNPSGQQPLMARGRTGPSSQDSRDGRDPDPRIVDRAREGDTTRVGERRDRDSRSRDSRDDRGRNDDRSDRDRRSQSTRDDRDERGRREDRGDRGRQEDRRGDRDRRKRDRPDDRDVDRDSRRRR